MNLALSVGSPNWGSGDILATILVAGQFSVATIDQDGSKRASSFTVEVYCDGGGTIIGENKVE